MKKVLFPGSFDPFTIGHEQVVNAALRMDLSVVICFMINPKKERMFPVDDEMLYAVNKIWEEDDRIIVTKYDLNQSTFCEINNIDTIIRGVRNSTDFEYEKTMADYHYKFFGLHTILVPTTTTISSTMIRELYKLGEFERILDEGISRSIYDNIINKI
jgi:pantetheine-phosphate adenylyltransferase